MSTVKVKSDSHFGLVPRVYAFLSALPDSCLFHREYQLRHPAAIYSLSFTRVIESLEEVFAELDILRSSDLKPNGKAIFNEHKIVNAQEKLISALASHIDDCLMILKACHKPPKIEDNERYVDKWLKNAGHPTVANFKRGVGQYRAKIAGINDEIKHGHGRLRTFSFVLPQENLIGYFLVGADSVGALGPHPKLHPNNTAISYNRDLRYHFTHLYFLGEELMRGLIGALGVESEASATRSPIFEASRFQSLVERVSGLSILAFPNEVKYPVPWVKFDRLKSELSLTYPSGNKLVAPPRGVRCFTSFSGDGFTNSFRMPYFRWQEAR